MPRWTVRRCRPACRLPSNSAGVRREAARPRSPEAEHRFLPLPDREPADRIAVEPISISASAEALRKSSSTRALLYSEQGRAGRMLAARIERPRATGAPSRIDRSIAAARSSRLALVGTSSSNAMTMSEPSKRWISTSARS
jgi:hypothetical protein